MFDELRFPTATAEVTLLILRYASEVVNRAVLFMVKKDEVRGLGQFGIELKGKSPDQVVRNIKLPLNQPSVFLSVIESRRSYLGALESNEQYSCRARRLTRMVMPSPRRDGKVAWSCTATISRAEPIKGTDTPEIFMNQAGGS
jgi:hypothetical protein